MENYYQPIERPWQGTVMVVLNIIGLAFTGILMVVMAIAMAVGATFLDNILDKIEMPIAIGAAAIMVVIMAIVIPLLILSIFVTIGIYKGAKWAVIVQLVLSALGVLTSIPSTNVVNIVIQGFIIYCCIVCLKEPFYNRNAGAIQ